MHRTALVARCLDPTVTGLTGDVALLGARGLVAGFLLRDGGLIPLLEEDKAKTFFHCLKNDWCAFVIYLHCILNDMTNWKYIRVQKF